MIRSRDPTQSLIPSLVLNEDEIIVSKHELKRRLCEIRDYLTTGYLTMLDAGITNPTLESFNRKETQNATQEARTRLAELIIDIEDTKDNERLNLP